MRSFRGQNRFKRDLHRVVDDPRDSKPPTTLLQPGKVTRGRQPNKRGGRGRNKLHNNFTNQRGRNLADRGKWKHDLFEKQIIGIRGKGDGNMEMTTGGNKHQFNSVRDIGHQKQEESQQPGSNDIAS